jgi:hypothetical protein
VRTDVVSTALRSATSVADADGREERKEAEEHAADEKDGAL